MFSEDTIKVFQYLDTYRERMIEDLREATAYKSVCGSLDHVKDLQNIIKWTEMWLKKLKATYFERFDIGSYTVQGKTIKLPMVLLATFGKDPKKKTICVYGRIDVQNADAKQWQTDPWTLVSKNRMLYGRGTCKGKNSILSWFHCIEAFLMQKVPLPVNLKFIIEGMSQMKSYGLEDFLYTQRLTFLRNIDFICINEAEWLHRTIPSIGHATCGVCHFEIRATSGTFDPKDMVEYIWSNFTDAYGNIIIPHINDDVVQVNPEIEQSLETVTCDLSLIKTKIPEFMQNWDQKKILMRLWLLPSITGEETKSYDEAKGDHQPDSKNQDGKAASKRFYLKIVPAQTPDRCSEIIMYHIKNLCERKYLKDGATCQSKLKKGKSICTVTKEKDPIAEVTCSVISATRPWSESSTSAHMRAAQKAVMKIFKYPASMIRESNDRPLILILDKVAIKHFL